MNASEYLALIFFLCEIALVGAVFHFLPRLARPDIFFAVTVAPGFRDREDARRILRRYRAQIWAVTAAGAVLVAIAVTARMPALIPAGPLLQIAGVLAAFVAARHRVLPHASASSPLRAAELAPRGERLPGGWPVQLGPFAMLAAAAAWLALRWQAIPARFPVHWNVNFEPDRWVTRTPGSVFAPLLLGAVICGFVALTAYGALRWSRRVDRQPVRATHEARFRRTFTLTLVLLEYAMAILIFWTSLLPLRPDSQLPWHFFGVLFLVFAVAGATIVLLARRRIEAAAVPTVEDQPAGGALTVGDRTPDSCWKLGMLYFNRADPALFVEKRFGLGFTLNFGNPWAWITIGILIVVFATFLLLMR